MRLSGVDPGIIRELSGIYKPFVKAFKELISNAYDADASKIIITLSDDFSTLDVFDDGNGMTPFEFHHDFARLGGSTAWRRRGKSPGGRPRIGHKGIGFLAVARYCQGLRVETRAIRPYQGTLAVPRHGRKTIKLLDELAGVVPTELLHRRLRVTAVRGADSNSELTAGKDYSASGDALHLSTKRALKVVQLEVDYTLDCSHLMLEAWLDFEYLLGLERKADLRLLDNFCTVKLSECDPKQDSFTRVRLHKLKDFVVRDLSAPATKGKARNIVSKNGKEQFLWRLARAAPIRDDAHSDLPPPMQALADAQAARDLPEVAVHWRSEPPLALRRPIYLPRSLATPLEQGAIEVNINEGGLRVCGYLLARSEVIYPAELRGIAVRVRNVAIGDANFLGWEHILSGPRKAAMSQISGELLVQRGLDVAEAINPGRESFYEESEHYRILSRVLFGSEESVGGIVGQAIRSILDRIKIRSQVTDKLAEARHRRQTLRNISSAVSFYSRAGGAVAEDMRRFFTAPQLANGLASARPVQLRPGHKLGGFAVQQRKGIPGGAQIDFASKTISIDFDDDVWSTTVYMGGRFYDVVPKYGKPEQPICEFDNEHERIYVNYGHPVKLHMEDATFLKTAIVLRLAHHVASSDADSMMSLALNMLSFRSE